MSFKLIHKTNKIFTEGKFYPLGADLRPDGVNFAVYSRYADEIYLLLFNDPYGDPADIIKMPSQTRFIWHIFVHGLKKGQLYAFKAKGKYDPKRGLRFNENKLLLDPYSKAITDKVINKNDLLFSFDTNSPDKDLSFDHRDNANIMPKSIVIDDNDFEWQNDTPPDIPMEKTIIYEAHLKGFTAHSSSKVKYPGTYSGFIEKIPYLQELGITSVEFMPIQEFYVEDFLVNKGLTNYWGYNTICFFAPEISYSTRSYPGCQVNEFKMLVRELHKANIEVILDVVYNHSGEGNELGPTISLKGLDNQTYYLLTGGNSEPYRYYLNYSGCGNSLNATNSNVIRFILDSLRYWVEVMHVDGFRFDLASVLGRDAFGFSSNSTFFDVVSQDPVLNKVKLIAEPWDIQTYQIGNFPVDWSEWNGAFRDTFRKFGKATCQNINDVALRFMGSPDLYEQDGRTSFNSINFITCHDGFTLNDLVSYDRKRNEANLENNNDGSNENNSWNSGFEGETDSTDINALRMKLVKNYMCYLLVSYGTPMILAGDEFLRTQKGNNNAYCQDNEISWINWDLKEKNIEFFDFCKNLISIIKIYQALQLRKYSSKTKNEHATKTTISFFGKDLDPLRKINQYNQYLSLYVSAEEPGHFKYFIFIIFNADYNENIFRLPDISEPYKWKRMIDTSLPRGEEILNYNNSVVLIPNDRYIAKPRSTVILLAR